MRADKDSGAWWDPRSTDRCLVFSAGPGLTWKVVMSAPGQPTLQHIDRISLDQPDLSPHKSHDAYIVSLQERSVLWMKVSLENAKMR